MAATSNPTRIPTGAAVPVVVRRVKGGNWSKRATRDKLADVHSPPERQHRLNEVVEPLDLEPNRSELLRYLGYRGPSAEKRILPEEIERELSRGQLKLRPRGVFSVFPIEEREPRRFRVGARTVSGQVPSYLANAEHLIAFIVTVGRGITDLAEQHGKAGNVLGAWVLDALGSWAAEAAVDALTRRITECFPGVGNLSPRYSPGYCGMPLSEQRVLFSLVEGTTIDVSLEESLFMQPRKSISGVMGIGAEGAFERGSSPCDHCSATNCSMRR